MVVNRIIIVDQLASILSQTAPVKKLVPNSAEFAETIDNLPRVSMSGITLTCADAIA